MAGEMVKVGTFSAGVDPRRGNGKLGRSGRYSAVFLRELERERLSVLLDARAARKRQAELGRHAKAEDWPQVAANKSLIDAGARILAECLPKRVEHTGEGGGPIVSQTGLMIQVVKEGS
jgi:hypothetical protein